MNTFLATAGALGGLAAFIAGVWAIVRGIFRQTDATKDNTAEIVKLRQEVKAGLDGLAHRVDGQERRITQLEVRRRW